MWLKSHFLTTLHPCSVFQENQKLREQNDELNGQILSLSLYEAKTLFATQTKAQSLAAEIDNASRDQVWSQAAVIAWLRANAIYKSEISW